MVRARAAFRCSKFYNTATDSLEGAREGGLAQLLSEEEISEDIELGSRMHAAGYSSIFITENLATGEVRGCLHSALSWSISCIVLLPMHSRCSCAQAQYCAAQSSFNARAS